MYMECRLCLDESKGEKHTPVAWLGPDRDVSACPDCDMIPVGV